MPATVGVHQKGACIKLLPVAALAALLSLPTPGEAASPIVVELFTSQSCSCCPPADALLAGLSRTRTDILALDSHVTYWDRLGWKGPYSLPRATERQRRYSALRGGVGIYTPQLVSGGRHQAIGSNRPAVLLEAEDGRVMGVAVLPLG